LKEAYDAPCPPEVERPLQLTGTSKEEPLRLEPSAAVADRIASALDSALASGELRSVIDEAARLEDRAASKIQSLFRSKTASQATNGANKAHVVFAELPLDCSLEQSENSEGSGHSAGDRSEPPPPGYLTQRRLSNVSSNSAPPCLDGADSIFITEPPQGDVVVSPLRSIKKWKASGKGGKRGNVSFLSSQRDSLAKQKQNFAVCDKVANLMTPEEKLCSPTLNDSPPKRFRRKSTGGMFDWSEFSRLGVGSRIGSTGPDRVRSGHPEFVKSETSDLSQRMEFEAMRQKYLDLLELKESLLGEDVALLRGSWLLQRCSKKSCMLRCCPRLREQSRALPRRQTLPKEAPWPREDLKKHLDEYSAQIVMLSHAWKSSKNWMSPDDDHLPLLTDSLDMYQQMYDNVAVFIDWCSLPQRPRSDEEEKSFGRAQANLGFWYAHQRTCVWLFTTVPGESQPIADRGWSYFEKLTAGLVKERTKLLDFGKFDDGCVDWVATEQACRADRGPPAIPEEFEARFKTCGYRSIAKQADIRNLVDMYRKTFEEVMNSAKELDYSGLGWRDTDITKLVAVLPSCHCLERLVLANNDIENCGAEELATVLPSCKRLRVLQLDDNQIGDYGASKLRAAVPRCPTLKKLFLIRGNRLGEDDKWRSKASL
jgi:hypothetical protein